LHWKVGAGVSLGAPAGLRAREAGGAASGCRVSETGAPARLYEAQSAMKSRVQILLEIDSVATWIPSDGVSGVADELEDMITDALEQCIEGLTVNKIKVIVNE
jgi:hypothetical protein